MTNANETPPTEVPPAETSTLETPDPESRFGPAVELRRLVDSLDGDHPTLGTLVETLGDRASAMLLLLLTLPSLVPMPGVPAGAVVGVIICVVSLQMLAGERHLHLPGWLGRRRVSRRLIDRVIDLSEPWLRRAGRWLTPDRMPRMTRPGVLRSLAPLIFLMGFLIALPIPFGNVVPAVSLLAISLGAILRDGGAVAAGVGIGGAALAVCVGLGLATLRLAELLMTP